MRISVVLFLLSFSLVGVWAQEVVSLRSGNFLTTTTQTAFQDQESAVITYNGQRGRFGLGFADGLPSNLSEGITTLKYAGNNQYYVWIAEGTQKQASKEAGFKGIYLLEPQWKIAPEVAALFQDSISEVDVKCFTFLDLNHPQMRASIPDKFQVVETDYLINCLVLRIPSTAVQELAKMPWFYWIEPNTPELELNNLVERTNHRVPVLEGPNSTFQLNGEDVVVGEWDGSGAQLHIDYDYRHTQVEPFTANSNGAHATHVAGTVLGAGIIDPKARGMAPKATLISYDFRGNIPLEMDTAVMDYAIELTQNSYSYGRNSDRCNTRGTYDGTSTALDELTTKYNYLLHVFAAGNSRSSNCLSGGYGTVHSGFQASKNSIAVGALTRTDGNSSFHSYGPVKDGRLKPEICGVGVNVYSTFPYNSYRGGYSGTSMACPGVSGVAALIHQLYEDSTSSQIPAHLLKGSLCNGADEIGRSGPDYQYGFGRVNGERTARIIANKNYVLDSVNQNGVYTDTLRPAQGLTELKIMLCWNDPAASPSANTLLVNDLDLEVEDSAGNIFLPWTLDAVNYTANAARGRDSLNPIEQVTLTPNSPYYILRVRGKRVTGGFQEFSLNWLMQDTSLSVIYPNGGEHWEPPSNNSSAQIIRWDSYGLLGTTKVEFSADSGKTWTTLASAVAANRSYYNWNNASVDLSTPGARVRVTKQGFSDVSDTTFHIGTKGPRPIGQVCSNQVHLTWLETPGAQQYRIYRLDSGEMRLFDTSKVPFYTMRNLQNDSSYWVAIGVVDSSGAEGLRGNAVRFIPNDNLSPVSFTSHPRDTQLCQGALLTLDVAVTGTSPIVLEWEESTDNGVSWSHLNNPSTSYIQSNIGVAYNQRLFRAKGVNQCLDTVFSNSAIVRIDTTLKFAMVSDTLALCLKQDSAVKLNYSASNTPEFMWYYKASLTSATTELGIKTSSYALYDVLEEDEGYYGVQLKNTCGTTGTPKFTFVEVRPPLTIQNVPTDTFCVGALAALSIQAEGGDKNGYRYWWTSATDTLQGKDNFYYPESDRMWEAHVFDDCSADTVSQFIAVVMRDSLRLNLGPDTTLCKGQAYSIRAQVSGGRNYSYKYLWGSNLASGRNVAVDSFNSATYQLRFTDGCSADTLFDEVQVTVRDALSVELQTSTDTACHLQEITIGTKIDGGLARGYAVRWNDGDTSFSRTLKLTENTSFSVALSDGCTPQQAEDSLVVTVRKPLSVSIAGPDTVCYGEQVKLNALATGGDEDNYQYTWNGNVGSSDYTTAFQESDTVRLRLADNCTPKDADTFSLVFAREPLSSTSIDRAVTICKGQSIAIGFVPEGGNSENYTISWEHTNEKTAALSVQPEDTTTYVYTLSDGCTVPEHKDSIVVNVRPALMLNLGEDIQKCAEDEVTVELNGSGGLASQHRYLVNGMPFTAPTLVFNDTISESMMVELLDDCTVESVKDSLSVSVVPLQSTDFELQALDHLTVELFTTMSPNQVEVVWGDGSSTDENVTWLNKAYDAYGIYEICKTETDNIGCSKKTCKEINLYNPFAVEGFNVELYPNPVGDENLTFRTDRIYGKYYVRLIDSKGRVLYEKSGENTSQKEFVMEMRGISSGYYILEALLNDQPYRFKVVKE
jgi:hypothetical protein